MPKRRGSTRLGTRTFKLPSGGTHKHTMRPGYLAARQKANKRKKG